MSWPALTDIEMDELKRFAEQEGAKKWKQVLQKESWWRGLPVHGFPNLYGLRDTHGPTWLAQFVLD